MDTRFRPLYHAFRGSAHFTRFGFRSFQNKETITKKAASRAGEDPIRVRFILQEHVGQQNHKEYCIELD